MMAHPPQNPARPFFLRAKIGQRFCIFHAPNPDKECRGGILYVHPFGEEMNKCRRIAALQARELAGFGFGVLQVDLFGCGDSDGEFRDAEWQIWKDDLAIAREWLASNVSPSISLWGIRLGALLALDVATSSKRDVDQLILWQPVTSGKSFMTQFLRMRLVNRLMAEGEAAHRGVQGLRDALSAGEILEVAGYELSPTLAKAIDGLEAKQLVNTRTPVHWYEVVGSSGRSMSSARSQLADVWVYKGIDLKLNVISGETFWATQEISECPELRSAMVQQFFG